MANNYEVVTVLTEFPPAVCTPERLRVLRAHGFHWEAVDTFYFYVPDSLQEDEDEEGEPLLTDWKGVLREMMLEAKLDEVVLQAADWCDKCRPGGFGGWAMRLTEHGEQIMCTWEALQLMREDANFGR